MPAPRSAYLLLLPLILFTAALLYSGGVSGPFLFDDHIHITQNRWVKIDSLAWPDLVQAWGSSFSPFPTDRPLAQVSFGINHALAGLDPWAFKATNVAIHLLIGLFVYLLVYLVYRAVKRDDDDPRTGQLVAIAAATLWLVHPLHVSTVLYTVQRMAQLSTLSLLAALSCYFWGRIQIANSRPGILWILVAPLIAMVGFLGKENAALLPLLLLVSEVTVLRGLPTGNRRQTMRLIWLLFIALPLLAALAYFAMHPGYFNHDGRPFSLEERVLTQARVLWLYLQWIVVPDLGALGMFHDDIAISRGWTEPPTTLAAVIALIALAIAAIFFRKKAPIFAFGALFFLAAHTLESGVFPLEMVFEHRNYLASVGPLLVMAHSAMLASKKVRARPVALVLGALLILSYSVVTYLRVGNWSSYENFILAQAENHPNSPRSNFLAAQLMISSLDKSPESAPVFAEAARTFLKNGLAVDQRCINCLFGMIVLDLHLNEQPARAVIDRLKAALRTGHVGATEVSISQFSYLVKWQQADGAGLAEEDLEGIFTAALANPAWNHTARGGIEAAFREYYEFVVGDLEAALVHARNAVAAWPDQWSYHMQLVKVLRKLGRHDEALGALDHAVKLADNNDQRKEIAEVRAGINRDLST